MEYNIDFFTQKKTLSANSRFTYAIKGAFYTVYSDYEGDYHIAASCKVSLQARASFYQKFICNDRNYPVFNHRFGFPHEADSPYDLLTQVLGLPEEVTTVSDGEKRRGLSVDEILSRLHYDEDILVSYNPPKHPDSRVVISNDPNNVHLINHLIENGFYLLNIERLCNDASVNELVSFPVYIDEERIPKYLLREEETSHKLIMDFVSDPMSITRKAYREYFAPLDHLNLNQKAQLAFQKESGATEEPAQKEARIALRRYFLALMKRLTNDFYRKVFHVRGIVGFTVLDHDFECINLPFRMIYQGRNFDMYAAQYRHFEEKDGKIIQEYRPSDYLLDDGVRKKLEQSYLAVHLYMERHKEYAFHPSIFLRMMGMPYPAFELLKDFDFEHGDVKSFLKLLNFQSGADYLYTGLILTTLDDAGNQVSMKDWMTDIPYYAKECKKVNFFVSDFNSFMKAECGRYIFSVSKQNDKKLNLLLNGDAHFYHEAFDFIFDKFLRMGTHIPQSSELKDFLVRNETNGVIIPIREYYQNLLSGMDSLEAENAMGIKDISLRTSIRMLVHLAFIHQFEDNARKFLETIKNKGVNDALLNVGETFAAPFHSHRIISKGRNFLAYQDENGLWFMDEDDRLAISNLIEIYHEHFYQDAIYPYTLQIFGRELVNTTYDDETCFPGVLGFLGLPLWIAREIDPSKDILMQIPFKKGIALYHDSRCLDMLREDYSLHYPMIFAEALRRGILLSSRIGNSSILYCLKKGLDENIQFYLDPDFCQLYTFEQSDYQEEYDDFAFAGKVTFKKAFMDVLVGKEPIDPKRETFKAEVPCNYGGNVMHSLYQVIYQEMFHTRERPYYLVSYQKDGIFISPGRNFNAYSTDGRIEHFGFKEEDIPFILKAIGEYKKHIGLLYSRVNQKAMAIVKALGLPVALKKRIYSLLVKQKLELSKEDLPVADVFTEDRTYTYFDNFSLTDIEFTSIYNSHQLRHEAMRQGLFLYEGDSIFSDDLINPQKMSENFYDTDAHIGDIQFLITDNPIEEVKKAIYPSEISFMMQVKDFIKSYDAITDISSELLFYTQEFLIYAYRKDKDFIRKFINSFVEGFLFGCHDDFLTKLQNDFALPEINKKLPYNDFNIFLRFFFVYLVQRILFKISKDIRQR